MRALRAVITGATKGIGLAISTKLWSMGYDLAICARNHTDLQALKDLLLRSRPEGKVIIQACDVSIQANVEAFAKTINDQWTEVEVLINNAGAFVPGRLVDETDGILAQLMNTNVMSAYWLTRSLLPSLRIAHQSGLIVNMCSIAGLEAYPAGGSYTVSKFALRGLSTMLREELKNEGIKVTTIFPGATWSASWDGADLPPTRIMLAEDIAEAVAGLLTMSPQAVVEELVMRPQLGDL